MLLFSVTCSADRSALGVLLIVVLEIAGEQLYFYWGKKDDFGMEQVGVG